MQLQVPQVSRSLHPFHQIAPFPPNALLIPNEIWEGLAHMMIQSFRINRIKLRRHDKTVITDDNQSIPAPTVFGDVPLPLLQSRRADT